MYFSEGMEEKCFYKNSNRKKIVIFKNYMVCFMSYFSLFFVYFKKGKFY